MPADFDNRAYKKKGYMNLPNICFVLENKNQYSNGNFAGCSAWVNIGIEIIYCKSIKKLRRIKLFFLFEFPFLNFVLQQKK